LRTSLLIGPQDGGIEGDHALCHRRKTSPIFGLQRGTSGGSVRLDVGVFNSLRMMRQIIPQSAP
jgi:hypothetical protein